MYSRTGLRFRSTRKRGGYIKNVKVRNKDYTMRKFLIGILITTFLLFAGCNDFNEKYNDDSTGKKEESLIEKPGSEDSSKDNDTSTEESPGEDNSSTEDDKDSGWSSDY